MSLKWNGKQFEQQLKKATSQGLLRAGTFYHAQCQRVVSKPNTGRRIKIKRKVKGGNTSSRTVYDSPSKPGEAPRLRTGFGRSNIVINHKGGNNPHARIGVSSNGMYMFWLEIGTRRVARRPWLMKTLLDNQEIIGKLAATGGTNNVN